MKLILIKIGKAFNVIRREGIIKGGKRVIKTFLEMLSWFSVKSSDILFISGGVGDSALYRVSHCAEELEKHGFKCSITIQDNPFLSRYAGRFKIFIFHRVLHTPNVAGLIKEIKKRNKEIIFGTDDLIFDPKYLKYMDYLKNVHYFEKKLYENGVGGEILSDPYVKNCVTTTSFLAKKLKEKDKKVFIAPNRLSDKDLKIVDNVLARKISSARNNDAVRLGYFSGTMSHNKDFAVITDAIMEIMNRHKNVELFLVGPLDVESKLNKFKNRLVQLAYVPREKHFENIAKVDINLAPLEIGNPFCESKSELKFFEAGILGIPTVASATQTFKETIDDGVDGFTAVAPEEWIEKLEKLIEDKELRKRMGERAREKSLRKYTNKNSRNSEYYDYLKNRIAEIKY